MLYYADESHVCTNGYVPYGWQFKNEDVYIPSEKAARLNIFGMITKRNQYKGFTTKESINADKIVDYLDRFSFNVTKKTVIVLDNASVHRNRKVKELRKIWENRGLFLVYLPPYSPELNPAEILWRILKGKWIRPIDYETTDSLFYCTNRALASVGTNLFVNYSSYKINLNSYLTIFICISSPRCHPAGERCSAPSAGSVLCCRSSRIQLPAFCRHLLQQNRCQGRYAHRP